jgi:DNA-binding transcriptional ArsR family regulator
MSFPGYDWAWKVIAVRDDVPRTAHTLVLRLGHHANKNLLAWPGVPKLAAATKTGDSTVERHLRLLAKLGLIVREPYMRPDGRGRGHDRIRLISPSAATRRSGHDQPADSAAATRRSGTQQPADSAGQSSIREPTTGTDKGKGAAVPTKFPVVDGNPVTPAEFSLSSAAVATFNERNGSRFGLVGTTGKATESLKRIVSRIREHPELTDSDLVRIVNSNFDNPWWTEEKLGGVGVIFGPKAWPRAMANDGLPANKSGRNIRTNIDRKPKADEEEPW